jgi:dipeptidyl aminopeptidase/acylaminoacyl peptidase
MMKPSVVHWLFALAILAAGPALAAAPPPLEAYGRQPAMDDVAISPSGAVYAYVADTAGKRTLMVRAVDGKVLFSVGVDKLKVRDLRFFDDKHLLIITSNTTKLPGFAARYEWLNAHSLNIENRKLATLMGVSYGAFSNAVLSLSILTIHGRDLIRAEGLINGGADTALFVVDPDSGVSVPFSSRFGVFDDDGQAVAWPEFYSDGDRWRLITRQQKGPGVRELFSKEDAHVDWPALLGFGRDKGKVLVQAADADDQGIYEVSIADGARRRLDFQGRGEATPLYDQRSQTLLGFRLQGEYATDFELYDPNLKSLWDAVRGEFPGAVISMSSITPDRKAAIVLVQTARDAGTYYLVDMRSGQIGRIGEIYPEVPDDVVAPQTLIHYKAADGTDIPAFLTLPKGRDARNLPLVVMPHGGPEARDEPGFDWWAQALASRGYAVLQPQFRGSTGFGLAFQRAGYGEWGRKMQTDLSDGVRALAAQGTIDAKRVCIVGASYGGYAAMAGPALDSGVYRCAVAYAGVSDLRRFLQQEKRDSGGSDTTGVRFWKRYMGAQSLNDGSLAAISPAQQAARFDAPILLIHGQDDTVVQIEQSQLLSDALRRAGKPVAFVSLPGEDHWLSTSETRLAMLRACVDFLQKYNPPD